MLGFRSTEYKNKNAGSLGTCVFAGKTAGETGTFSCLRRNAETKESVRTP